MSDTSTLDCQDCRNIRFPREDTILTEIVYVCMACNRNHGDVDPHCVYVRKSVRHLWCVSMADFMHPLECPKCGDRGAIFFGAPTRFAKSAMPIYDVCSNKDCKRRWLKQID